MIDMKILSPTGTIFDGTVAHATFPGEAGSFSVYSLHAPLISTLKRGEIVYFPANATTAASAYESVVIDSGFVEVLNDVLTVCVEQSKQLQL
ncbi:MAG: F0F1 ATP synthase subunit epsilon [Tannerella sp.]|jgi:F-type H+-transporting ATPase subunit epsilon|nr:F0F1 ATP synthase subunit epsilon [Tannerella sp.]